VLKDRFDEGAKVVFASDLAVAGDTPLMHSEVALGLKAFGVATNLSPAGAHLIGHGLERRIGVSLRPPVLPDVDDEDQFCWRNAELSVVIEH